jgi:adenine-specific DNA-methyltransferase
VKSRGKTLIPSYLEVRNKTDELFVDIFGYEESPKGATVKPVELIYLLISFYTDKNNIVVDFFAGSGTTAHAVMKLNKEDGGKRKFILVEMADYFDTIIIPRIKKVAYSFNWKDGKPQDKDGIGVFFKYQYIEQYEDTLDNIELKEDQKAQELFKDEYLIKYFLDFETKDSPYLLNIENLKNPFAYKLKVNLSEVGEPREVIIDIPETFNYLLGIKLKKIKKRKNNGKDYLFILGEKEGQTYAIVWRELSSDEEDVEKDKEFIKKELKDWKPQIVYVNCPENTVLTPDFGDFQVEIRYIEPDFKKLMES